MRLLVAADIHGAYERLGRFLRDDDVLISLGDHINILDYKDLSGVLSRFVSRETIRETLELIQGNKTAEARARLAAAAGSVPNLFAQIRLAAQEDYFAMSAAIPCRAYFIYGNVDFPEALENNLEDHHRLCLAETIEIEGRRIGLASGHPPGPYSFGMPGEVPREEFAERLHELGAVDVLGVHSPPAIAGMTYDVVADREEEGSPDTLYISRLHRPRLVLFGHIHQPQVSRHVDETDPESPILYLNVGCFRDTGVLLQIDPQTLEIEWVKVD